MCIAFDASQGGLRLPVSIRALMAYLACVSPIMRLTGATWALSSGTPQGAELLEALVATDLTLLLTPVAAMAAATAALLVARPTWGRHLLIRAGLFIGLALAAINHLAWEAIRTSNNTLSFSFIVEALGGMFLVAAAIGLPAWAAVSVWRRLPTKRANQGLTVGLFIVGMTLLFIPGAMTGVMSVMLEDIVPAATRRSSAITASAWLGFIALAYSWATPRPNSSAAARSPDSSAPSI